MQIRRLCLSLTEESPEGAELEAFLAHPNHVLARVSRDISADDVRVNNLEKPMQVCHRVLSSHREVCLRVWQGSWSLPILADAWRHG